MSEGKSLHMHDQQQEKCHQGSHQATKIKFPGISLTFQTGF